MRYVILKIGNYPHDVWCGTSIRDHEDEDFIVLNTAVRFCTQSASETPFEVWEKVTKKSGLKDGYSTICNDYGVMGSLTLRVSKSSAYHYYHCEV